MELRAVCHCIGDLMDKRKGTSMFGMFVMSPELHMDFLHYLIESPNYAVKWGLVSPRSEVRTWSLGAVQLLG